MRPTPQVSIPKRAWWVLAPLAWVWQYLAYIPAHLIRLWLLGGDWRRLDWRPWFRDRLP